MQAPDPLNPRDPAVDPVDGVAVAVERRGKAVVVQVSGELDLLTTPRLDDAASRALREQPSLLVLDLTGVTFLGSAGMASLVAVRQAAGDDLPIRLAAADPVVVRAMEVVGLDEEFPLYPTCEDALAG
ncbi:MULTISPECIES: STAS domain-containing protein [Amycolatopsis]|uniref:Anti-sigma factor antagonist n=1 Tax=Amycolatopsis tucumanensis TaxID=401106 RepID=A0ABP7JIB8_9PSEU|nr:MULTISPECIES: STAS domain-containing protein [Amycolatopsis]MCF6425190.1 STAS domain-containing protein [Amycolatopsis tucumanensis]